MLHPAGAHGVQAMVSTACCISCFVPFLFLGYLGYLLLSLSSNHFPDRFTLCPSSVGLRGTRFALVMRRKPECFTAQLNLAHRSTFRAFSARDPTFQKQPLIKLQQTRKNASHASSYSH